MKQFNLKEYLANPSREVVTRSGHSVRIICTDARNNNYPIIALVSLKSGTEVVCAYTKNGTRLGDKINVDDLFFESEKHEGWVNIFKGTFINAKAFLGESHIYSSEEIAKSEGKKCNNYLSTIKIEWEE